MTVRTSLRLGLVVMGLVLVGGSSGCVTVAATEHGFTKSWSWASQDKREVTFGSPWSDQKVRLVEQDDRSVRLDDAFVGTALPHASSEEAGFLSEARSQGLVIDPDEVLSAYDVTRPWKLPGGQVDVTALVVARDSDDAPWVFARAERRWLRCRASELIWRHGSTLKETAVIAGWIPIWTTLGAVDAVLICATLGLVLA
jgi:hypothetical protein